MAVRKRKCMKVVFCEKKTVAPKKMSTSPYLPLVTSFFPGKNLATMITNQQKASKMITKQQKASPLDHH